jgi:hypothetical protein
MNWLTMPEMWWVQRRAPAGRLGAKARLQETCLHFSVSDAPQFSVTPFLD